MKTDLPYELCFECGDYWVKQNGVKVLYGGDSRDRCSNIVLALNHAYLMGALSMCELSEKRPKEDGN